VRKVRMLRTLLRGWGNVLFHVLPAALLVALGLQGIRHLGTSRLFALEQVEVEGAARCAPEEIRAALGPLVGQNLFALGLDDAAERVAALPGVREAAVKRVFPHTLRVAIVERAPAARALLGGTVQIVDETGAVLGPAGPDLADDLPVLVGLDGLQERVLRARLEVGARAVARMRAVAGAWLDEVSEIDLSRPDRIAVVTTTPGPALLLDSLEIERNLGSYLALRGEIDRRVGPLAYVDLRWRDRISVLPSDDDETESN
jgi:cell division protein FtsQ